MQSMDPRTRHPTLAFDSVVNYGAASATQPVKQLDVRTLESANKVSYVKPMSKLECKPNWVQTARTLSEIMMIPVLILILYYLIWVDSYPNDQGKQAYRWIIVIFVSVFLVLDLLYMMSFARDQWKDTKDHKSPPK